MTAILSPGNKTNPKVHVFQWFEIVLDQSWIVAGEMRVNLFEIQM